MMENDQPELTLEEVFDKHFYPRLSINKKEIKPAIDHFYTKVFPSLKGLTQPKPGSMNLIETAIKRGYRIALATNPLFPLTAILQRLSWAGLSPELYQFELIPSYETFHFAKPNPVFFIEFLAQLGWPDRPILMIGDDINNDIHPASKVGIAVYWVDGDKNLNINSNSTIGCGSLSDLFVWLDSISTEELIPDFTSIEAMLAILRSTPAALFALCRNLDSRTWKKRPEVKEWCPTEIICHLRDVEEEINLPRIRSILSLTNPFIPGVDSDEWAEVRNYIAQDGIVALKQFTNQRKELLDLLSKLIPENWELPARHAIFGPTSLKELVKFITTHDRLHIQQLFRTIQDEIKSLPKYYS